MRIYTDEQKKELAVVICNMCQKELDVVNGIVKEGCFQGEQNFGYFSERDGQVDRFDLCEECYHKMIKEFKIAVETKDIKEFL